MRNRLNPLFLSLIVIGSAAIAHADSATWTGGANATWSDLNNWSGPPVAAPSVSGDIATFNSAGNSNTTITGIPNVSLSEIRFESASAAAYSLSSSITWTPPADGGVTVNSAVTTDQNLSGIQFIRPAGNTTISFVNQGSGLLKLGTMFNTNTVANKNARIRFSPASGSTIEIASGKTIDNASTAGRTTSILLDDAGTLKMSGNGSYTGTDAEGNALTLHRGTMQISSVNNIADTGRSGIGRVGRIQFGEASQTYTATLQYTHTAGASTDRPFHIIAGNTGVFDITDALVTLELTGIISASGTTDGGGSLTKKGLGTLKISGTTNTYNGVTRIEQGTLILGDVLAIQNSAYDTSSPGTLDLSLLSGNPTFGGLISSTNYNLPSNLTLSPPTGRTVSYSGILGESSPILTLTKSGGGTQVLSGDNTFTGNVTVTAGRLTLAHSNALGLADPNPPYNGRKGLIMQGGTRSLGLTGGITIPANLDFFVSSNTFDGGGIENLGGNNEIQSHIYFSVGLASLNLSSSAGKLTMSGNIAMTSSARTLHLGGVSVEDNTISGNITETLTDGNPNPAIMPLIKQAAGKWILSGANTYKGDTTVNGGTLVLASGGSQKFYPKADASSNKITGNATGALTLDGALNIELTAAAAAPDATSWLLVDVDNVDETYDIHFTVSGFTESPAGTWKKTTGGSTFTFTEIDGRLVKTAATGGNTYADWLTINAPATGFVTDSDNDGVANGVENVLGTSPNVSSAGLTNVSATASTVTYKHTLNPTIASDVSYSYQWSTDLVEWKAGGESNTGAITAIITPSAPVSGVVTVTTAITSGTAARIFTRIKVTQP